MKTMTIGGVVLGCSLLPAAALAQQSHVNLDWAPQRNVENLAPFGANVISPEVHDDQRITFRVRAPEAKSVALTGGPICCGELANDLRFPRKTITEGDVSCVNGRHAF